MRLHEGVEYGDQNNSNTHILYIVAVWGTSEGRIYLNIEDRLTLNSDAKASKTTSDEELYFSAVTYVPKTQFKERDEINENSIDYFNR